MAKLARRAALSNQDRVALSRLTEPVQRVERGDILREGAELHAIALVLEGWAYHYKQLENGKRQITAVFVPGDLCEPFGAVPKTLNYTLAAMTHAQLVYVGPHAFRDLAQTSVQIEKALWWDLLLTDALLREHMVSLGRRSALERVGHFLCEMHLRLETVGLVDRSSYELPLTQADLADLLGLSPVHVNRSLQELRTNGLISLRNRRATIADIRALRELSMFDPANPLLRRTVET